MGERIRLVENIVASMQGIGTEKRDEIINRQLCHFFRAAIGLGMAIPKGLGVELGQEAMAHTTA